MKIRLIGLIGPIGLICFMFYVLCSMFPGEVRAEGLRFLHTDHLGSVAAVSDERGEKVGEGRYLPFGSRVYNNYNDYNNYKRGFTGQERDNEINLYNYNARLYNPQTAQFAAADKLAGTSPATTNTNRFSYVGGNPLRFTDPSGNQPVFDPGAGGGSYFPQLPEELETDYYYSGDIGLKASIRKRREMALDYIEEVAIVGLSYPGLTKEANERIKTVLGNTGVVVLDRNSPRVGFQAGEEAKRLARTANFPIFYIGSVSVIFIPSSDTLADSQNYLYVLSHDSYHALHESDIISLTKLDLYRVVKVLGYSALFESHVIEGEIEAYTYGIQISNKAGREELLDWWASFYLSQLKQRRLGVVTPWDKVIFWLTRGVGEKLEEEYNIRP